MTIAERISERFPKGGQQWENEDGEKLEDLCAAEAAECFDQYRHQTPFVVKYIFRDGSSIVTAGDAWDLGYCCDQIGYSYGSCFCWPAAGHSATCPYNPDRPCE